MLSLNNIYQNQEIISLQETLVDLMFDYIQDRNILLNNIIDKDLLYFKNSINKTFQINIVYKQTSKNYIHAQFIKPDIIEIFLPNNYIEMDGNHLGNQLLHVFFHELSHYFTSQRVPDYIIKRIKIDKNQTIIEKLANNFKYPPGSEIPWNSKDLNLVKQYLDYIFQSKELANFALSFAISFIETKEDINNFFDNNRAIIKRVLEKKLTLTQLIEYYRTISSNQLRLLFQIHYFVYYLKESKYQRKIIQLKKLILKYYRRLLIYY